METKMTAGQAYSLFHEGILAFAKAEQQGIRTNIDYIVETKKRLSNQIIQKEKELMDTDFYKQWRKSTAGSPNMNSNLQLANFLYKVKKIEPKKLTDKGNASTDEEALELLNIPELTAILEIRKLKKLRDTYLSSYEREQVNGYIHPFFNLHTVVTYRSSSDRPNFQNIPKRDKEASSIIRNALFPSPGHLLMEMDFSGIEVAIATCYHQDPNMIKYLTENKDLHGDMAKQLFCLDTLDKNSEDGKMLRYSAKNGFVFPQFYGDYYKNNAISICAIVLLPHSTWTDTMGIEVKIKGEIMHLGAHLRRNKITSFNKFVEHIKSIEYDFWNRRFRVYGAWKESIWNKYKREGKIKSLTGFTITGIMKKNEVINYPVQGSAFHCLLWCFVKLTRIMEKRKWKTKLIGQIHDSIVLDVHTEELSEVIETIEQVTSKDLLKAYSWINVPMKVSIDIGKVDKSWAEI